MWQQHNGIVPQEDDISIFPGKGRLPSRVLIIYNLFLALIYFHMALQFSCFTIVHHQSWCASFLSSLFNWRDWHVFNLAEAGGAPFGSSNLVTIWDTSTRIVRDCHVMIMSSFPTPLPAHISKKKVPPKASLDHPHLSNRSLGFLNHCYSYTSFFI